MSEFLEDLSAPALVAAIKANLFAWWRYLGRSPRAEWYDSPSVTWLLTGVRNSFVNAIVRTRAEPGQADALIEKTLAHFRSRAVSKFSWWTEAGTQPADLGQLGFREYCKMSRYGQWPGDIS
jgi:hypothetical protein